MALTNMSLVWKTRPECCSRCSSSCRDRILERRAAVGRPSLSPSILRAPAARVHTLAKGTERAKGDRARGTGDVGRDGRPGTGDGGRARGTGDAGRARGTCEENGRGERAAGDERRRTGERSVRGRLHRQAAECAEDQVGVALQKQAKGAHRSEEPSRKRRARVRKLRGGRARTKTQAVPKLALLEGREREVAVHGMDARPDAAGLLTETG